MCGMTSSDRDETAAPEQATQSHAPAAPSATAVADQQPQTVVVPADEDPIAAAGSEVVGGAPGRRALLGIYWLTPARFLALAVIVVFTLGLIQKVPCYNSGWF